MNEVLYWIALALPTLLLALLTWRLNVMVAVLVVAAVTLPATAALLPASDSPSPTNELFDPVTAWGEGECVGKRGVDLLMRDSRITLQSRWWVMCRDGSKSAVVTQHEYPTPDDRYTDSPNPIV